MNLRDLRYLVALAELKHFGRAAAASFVSQPTLSTQIKKLEDELGVALVERSPRAVRLTADGSVLARLRALLMKLAAQIKRQEAVPEWVRSVPAGADQIEAAILLLILAWAPAPPQRQSERVRQENSLKAIFGFGMVRRMIAASNFASQGTVTYDRTRQRDRGMSPRGCGNRRGCGLAPAASICRQAEPTHL